MKTRFALGFLGALSLVVGCGGDIKVVSDDVNGVNAKKAKNAVFGVLSDNLGVDGAVDANGDGEIDPPDGVPDDLNLDGVLDANDEIGVNILIILASNDPDFEANLALNFDDNADNDVILDNEVSATGIAFKIEVDGVTGFAAGEVLTGNGIDIVVDAGIAVVEDGVTIANTIGDGAATLTIDDLDADLVGNLAGVMTTDFSVDEINGDDIGQVAIEIDFNAVAANADADTLAELIALINGFIDIE